MNPAEMVAQVRGQIHEIENEQLEALVDKQQVVLIDVRELHEFEQGSISEAINIPRGILEFHLDDRPSLREQISAADGDLSSIWDRHLILYSRSGGRSALAAQSLQCLGFTKVMSLRHGITGWIESGRSV